MYDCKITNFCRITERDTKQTWHILQHNLNILQLLKKKKKISDQNNNNNNSNESSKSKQHVNVEKEFEKLLELAMI